MFWDVHILQSRMWSNRFDWGTKQWGTEESKAQYLATKTRQVRVRVDSTVLVASEPEVGAMRYHHPAEAPLTAAECTSKTQMSQTHHAHQATVMPAHKNNHLTSYRYLSWTNKHRNESGTSWIAPWNSIHCVWLTDPSSDTITLHNIFVSLKQLCP